MSDVTPTVTRNDDKERYDIHLDEVVAGFTEFRVDDHGRLVFPHTEIDPAFAGRGLGGTLVGHAMADLAARGETVVPVCSFVVKYLRENDVAGLDVAWRPTADDAGSDRVDAEDT
ncbi:GNAT family N-acetyltransferase [uncultured Microbacterium sp.]|uniref:GNAT family N-acetyltransferase n=1 Tax=uncultured Microbacterium sp. TaxID=191216 RepID=UPI00260D16AB|nr:GNAT family N-acetyltransferase [uncultured Microbacterium sp.]